MKMIWFSPLNELASSEPVDIGRSVNVRYLAT